MGVMERTCLSCGDILSTKMLLHEHEQLHRRNKCLICEEQFSLKSKLTSHFIENHYQNPFKCIKCLYETNNINNLKSHHVCHWSKGEFRCTKCSYSGNRRNIVNKHEMFHH